MDKKVFCFDVFLEDIYDIFFRSCKCEEKEVDKCVEMKIQDVGSLMRSVHNKMVRAVKDEYMKLK